MPSPHAIDPHDSSDYDPAAISQHFDDFGTGEWERLVRTPADVVSLHVHTQMLAKHLATGQRVLEIGAGAGRFTQALAAVSDRSEPWAPKLIVGQSRQTLLHPGRFPVDRRWLFVTASTNFEYTQTIRQRLTSA